MTLESCQAEVSSLREQLLRTQEALKALSEASVDAVFTDSGLVTLQSSTTHYQSFYESMADGAITLDAFGHILSCNEVFARLAGQTSNDLRGQQFSDLFSPKLGSLLSFEGGENRKGIFEATLRSYQDKLIPVSISIRQSGRDESLLMSVVVVDLSERKAFERQVTVAAAERAANLAKSKFLATMSHEIRTPLNAIIGTAFTLSFTTLDENQRRQFNTIEAASRSLLGLINDILDLAKIESGEVHFAAELIDFKAILSTLDDLFSQQAIDKKLKLHYSCDPTLNSYQVIGDAHRIQQMLVNLIANALKFTHQGEIHVALALVEVRIDSVTVKFTVQDTGIGIAADMQPKLFSPFVQADTSVSRAIGGTGLGLALVGELVTKLGGHYGVNSELDVGSTFWFELPLKLQTTGRGLTAKNAEMTGPLQVLCYCDDDIVSLCYKKHFQSLGWKAFLCEDLATLFQRLVQHEAKNDRLDVVYISLHGKNAALHEMRNLVQHLNAFDVDIRPGVFFNDDIREVNPHVLPENCGISIGFINETLMSPALLYRSASRLLSTPGNTKARVKLGTVLDINAFRWLTGIRVLVVDDSQINLDVCQRILEIQGATVYLCDSGKQALDFLSNQSEHYIDVILMDIRMPGMDGYEATRKIRNELHFQSIPILALTAGAIASKEDEALSVGMNGFLIKPIDPIVLITTLLDCVNNPMPNDPASVSSAASSTNFSTDWPEIPGIDSQFAKQQMLGDVDVYKELLMMFHRSLDRLIEAITTHSMISADDYHRLKGEAGNLGALDLMNLLDRANKQALVNVPMDQINAQLLPMMRALLQNIDACLAS